MSIEKITSAIIEEAQTECEQIMNAANIKGKSVVNELEKRIKIEIDAYVKDAAEERERIISRRKSVADIDSKKIVLAKKQELINRCFDNAVEFIISMDEEKYVEFLADAGKASGLIEGTLIFNEKEKNSIGKRVVDMMNQKVPGGKFTLSDETKNL